MKANYTHIFIVLDRSGSMEKLKDVTIDNFNRFIDEQAEVPGECTYEVLMFNGSFKHIGVKDIKDRQRLGNLDYRPHGSTALYDAIGTAIDSLGVDLYKMDESKRPSKVVVMILTDGYENSSTMYSRNMIKDKILLQTNTYSWEFLYLGANQDAVLEGNKLGISIDTSMTYHHDPEGINNVYAAVSTSLAQSRTRGTATKFTDADRLKVTGVN